MLVIVSDLHLTDGSCGTTVAPGAFQIFAQRVRELAMAASWRADGAYRPIGRVDLVLLGDILDPIRSSCWASLPEVRPWGDPHGEPFIEQITRITTGILRHNDRALAVLRRLVAEGGIMLPPATRSGQPDPNAQRQPVDVQTHYMVGNHDWFYHLPRAEYDLLRQKIVCQMGLASRYDEPFAHDIAEQEELLRTMRRHKVTARHGDLYDPLNFEGDRDSSSLGDAIVIELLGRFVAEVETRLAGQLPASTLLELREIDHIRPLLLIPVWLDGMLQRTCPRPSMRQRVKAIWDRIAEDFLALDFVRRRNTFCAFNLVDGLHRALKFSKRLSIGWASSITSWLNRIRGCSGSSYWQLALAEQDFRNRRSKHIVYGHTHAAESLPLDASYAEGYVLNQMYFNSGTWRRVYRQTRFAPEQHEFIAQEVMSYLAFFHGDERRGRPYETWSATLGFDPSEVTVHRIDPAASNHATSQSVSAPNVPGHAPHFTPLSGLPGSLPARRV